MFSSENECCGIIFVKNFMYCLIFQLCAVENSGNRCGFFSAHSHPILPKTHHRRWEGDIHSIQLLGGESLLHDFSVCGDKDNPYCYTGDYKRPTAEISQPRHKKKSIPRIREDKHGWGNHKAAFPRETQKMRRTPDIYILAGNNGHVHFSY